MTDKHPRRTTSRRPWRGTPNPRCSANRRASAGRFLVVVAGLIACQAVLYGPSLVGRKILLPLDYLSAPGVYIPAKTIAPLHDRILSDLVLFFEPSRQYVVSEFKAGRFPLWNPTYYLVDTFVYVNYSPCTLLNYCVRSPVVLAWTQLLQAVVTGVAPSVFSTGVAGRLLAGCGDGVVLAADRFFYSLAGIRHAVGDGLVAVDFVGRRSDRATAVGVRRCGTGSDDVADDRPGRLDIAGQVLLASGLYAVWRWMELYGRVWRTRRAVLAIAAMAWDGTWALPGLAATLADVGVFRVRRPARRVAARARRSGRPWDLPRCRKWFCPTAMGARSSVISTPAPSPALEGTGSKAARRATRDFGPRCSRPRWRFAAGGIARSTFSG